MKKNKLIMVALTTVFLAVNFSYAQAQGQEQDKSFLQRKDRITQELGLTTEQQVKLEANRKGQRQEFTKLMTAMREKQKRLQNELNDPKVTRAKLQPLIAEIKTLQAQMLERRIDGLFAVKLILTPEQFIKFQEMTQKWHKGRKGSFQEGQESRIGRKCYKG